MGAREGAEEVRGEEVGECFPGGEEEGGCLYGVRAAARRQYACPGSSTTSLQCKLHILSLSFLEMICVNLCAK